LAVQLLLPGTAVPNRNYKNKSDPRQFQTETPVF